MTQQQTTVNVGDKVIVVKSYGAKPEIDTVVKVTPKGAIRVGFNEGVLLKLTNHFEQDYYSTSESIFEKVKVYLFSDITAIKLTAEYEQVDRDKKEKIDREEKRRQEIEQQEQNELEEVKTLLNNKLPILSKMVPDYNPDETIYVLDISVNPKYVDRKGSHEILIVKVKKETSWRNENYLMGYFTYSHGSNDSFPSCSGFEGNSPEEIVWECIKSQYFSW